MCMCVYIPFSISQVKMVNSHSLLGYLLGYQKKRCFMLRSAMSNGLTHTAKNNNSIVHTCSVIRKKGSVPSVHEQASSILGDLRVTKPLTLPLTSAHQFFFFSAFFSFDMQVATMVHSNSALTRLYRSLHRSKLKYYPALTHSHIRTRSLSPSLPLSLPPFPIPILSLSAPFLHPSARAK